MSQKKTFLTLVIALTLAIAASPGRAQVVVSIDSGVAPGTSNIAPGGFDFFRGNNDPNDETRSQHGTVVAKVMADVYNDIQIIPLKVVGPNFAGNTALSNEALNYAVGLNSRVVVKSTGAAGSLGPWQQIVDAGKVAVMRAGNESESNPNRDGSYAKFLGGRAVVVGGVDRDGNIAVYSNRAGDSAQVYLVAPGYNQFSNIEGTSFAAPRVAAVATQILAQNPNLSSEKVVEIMLTTADDKGEPGVDPVYGWGLLNPEAATAPIDTGGGSSSGGGALAVAALVLGGGIIWAITSDDDAEDSLENTFITDVYDRGFIYDLTRMVSARSNAPGLASLLSDFDQTSDTFIVNQSKQGTSYATYTTSRDDLQGFNERLDPSSTINEYDDNFASLSLFYQSVDGSRHQLAINDSIQTNVGALALYRGMNGESPRFEYTEAFTSPFMGFTNQGIASYSNYVLNESFGFGFGLSANEDTERYGLESDSAMIQGTYNAEKVGLGLQLGSLREMGNLFGGASGGAFSVDESNTVSVGLSGSYELTETWSVIGNYTEGFTSVDDWNESYLQNFSTIHSNSYGLGLVGSGIFTTLDRFGLGYSRPLKVKDGSADLILPAGREDFGQPVYYSENRINLNPGASEHAFEAYYSFIPRPGMDLTAYFLHRANPDHNPDAGSESTVLATLQFRF